VSDIDQNSSNYQEPGNLRFLRVLVTILTATMIIGLLAIFALLVMRFSAQTALLLPDTITLPSGTAATAFTQGPDWYAVVTTTDEILIFNRADSTLRQTLQIRPQP
jgi:hypothetical protein